MGEAKLPIAWDKITEVEDAMRGKRKGISETPTPKSQVRRRPVSYTHLTLPTTPYV